MATRAAGCALALATCASATATTGAIGRVANARRGVARARGAARDRRGGAANATTRFERARRRSRESSSRACARARSEGLKIGVAALGMKLSLQRDRGDGANRRRRRSGRSVTTGVVGTPAARAAATRRLGERARGLSAKVGALLAAGTSVCGVTAIGGLAPAIGASQREIGVAVANVTAYGTLGMLANPWIGESGCFRRAARRRGCFWG